MLSWAPQGLTPRAFDLVVALSPENAIATLLRDMAGRKIGPKIVAELARHPRGASLLEALADAKPRHLLFLKGHDEGGRFDFHLEGAGRWSKGGEQSTKRVAEVLLEVWGVPRRPPRGEESWRARRDALGKLVVANISNAIDDRMRRRRLQGKEVPPSPIHVEVNCPTLGGKLAHRSMQSFLDQVRETFRKKGRRSPTIFASAAGIKPQCFLGQGGRGLPTADREVSPMVIPSLDWWSISRRQPMSVPGGGRAMRSGDWSDWVLLGPLPEADDGRWLALRVRFQIGVYRASAFRCAEVSLVDGMAYEVKVRDIEWLDGATA
jgi:hypothetical protein